jgi:hypothetical protein
VASGDPCRACRRQRFADKRPEARYGDSPLVPSAAGGSRRSLYAVKRVSTKWHSLVVAAASPTGYRARVRSVYSGEGKGNDSSESGMGNVALSSSSVSGLDVLGDGVAASVSAGWHLSKYAYQAF